MQLPLAEWAEGSAENPPREQNARPDEETQRLPVSAKRRKRVRKSTPQIRAKEAAYMREWRKRLSPEQKARYRATFRRWCGAHRESRKRQDEESRERHWDRVLRNSRERRAKKGDYLRAFYRRYLPAYRAKQRLENPQFLLADRMRSTLKRGLQAQGLQKVSRTEEMVGCSMTELKIHLEVQFVNGMAWGLPDSFNIDHFVPIRAFDLRDAEEAAWAFNWRNLRPLDPGENKRKSDKLPSPLPSWLPAHIAERILARQ